jgi:hypothetical protein
MTIYTAIFGDYDTLKEPLIITPGWKYICYTDQDFESKHWTIKKMLPIGTAQHTARRVKIYFQNYIDDEYSIFIDGSFIVNCNLNAWWRQFKPDMTCIRHPTRNCIYEEAQAVVKNGRKVPGDSASPLGTHSIGHPDEKADQVHRGFMRGMVRGSKDQLIPRSDSLW